MDINVYCDESQADLFASEAPAARYVLIGSLWLPSEKIPELKREIGAC